MQSFVSKVPMMVVEGNHELEEQVGGHKFVAYSSRFAFPSEESGSFSTFYYSFNAGGIHFIMLGAYADYKKSGAISFSFIIIVKKKNLIFDHIFFLIYNFIFL